MVAENKIFIPTTTKEIIALNATNGTKIWSQNTKGVPARRGLIYLAKKGNYDAQRYIWNELILNISIQNISRDIQ